MEYEVQLAPIDKAVVTAHGFFEALCSSCSSSDCTNPIKEMETSVAGQIKKQRLWVEREGIIRQVTNCKGYIGDAIPPMGTQS
jgi:hypothetical protein